MSLCSEDYAPPLCFDGRENDLAVTIVEVHDCVVLKRGYNPSLSESQRDEMIGKIESVISSVFGSFFGSEPSSRYQDVFHQVAVFAAHLSKDHIFPDGNKRTTVVMSVALLYIAGYTLDIDDPPDSEDNILYKWVQDVVTGGKEIEELADVLRDHKVSLTGNSPD